MVGDALPYIRPGVTCKLAGKVPEIEKARIGVIMGAAACGWSHSGEISPASSPASLRILIFLDCSLYCVRDVGIAHKTAT